MAKLEIFLLILSILCFGSVLSDLQANNGGIYVKVVRETGVVMIGYQQDFASNYSISFQLDKVSELNSSMVAIGTGNSYQHTFTSFTNLTYFSNAITPTIDNISTSFFSSYMNFQSSSGRIQTDITIFGGSGTLTSDRVGQGIPVSAGNVLISVTLTWQFCGMGDNCTYDYINNGTNDTATNTGEYLDTAYTFTTVSSFALQSSSIANVRNYTIGGNSVLFLHEKYFDGNATTSTSFNGSYPLLQTKTINYRFPKFLTSVTYGFLIDMGSNPNNVTTSGAPPIPKTSVFNLLYLLVLIVSAKIYIL